MLEVAWYVDTLTSPSRMHTFAMMQLTTKLESAKEEIAALEARELELKDAVSRAKAEREPSVGLMHVLIAYLINLSTSSRNAIDC